LGEEDLGHPDLGRIAMYLESDGFCGLVVGVVEQKSTEIGVNPSNPTVGAEQRCESFDESVQEWECSSEVVRRHGGTTTGSSDRKTSPETDYCHCPSEAIIYHCAVLLI